MASTTFSYLCCCIVLLLGIFQLSQAIAPARIAEPWNPGAKCVNLSSIPDSALLSCRSYLTYDMIYVDDLQAARESVWLQAQVLVVAADICSYSAFRQICVSSFRPCFEVTEPNTNETFAVGGYPCRVLCDDVATNCLATAMDLFHDTVDQAKALLKCSYPVGNKAFYGFPTLDVFPPGNYTLQLDGQNITGNPLASSNFTAGPFQCYDANRYLVGTPPPLQCGEGLIAHPEGTYCTMACPQPLMSNDEYDAIEILISVLSWCSVFSCFLTITILLLFSRKRTQGPALALIFAVGMESSAGCIGTIIGHEDVWCSGGTANNFGDPWCTIQGIVNVFFELAGISLWFIIIVDIFLSLVLGPLFKGGNYRSSLNLRKDVEIFGKSLPLAFNPIAFSYVFFPMTLPLIPVIIALGGHQIGYDGSNLWCTIHSGSDVVIYTSETGIQTYVQGTGNPWNMTLMTGPSVVVVLIGVFLLLAIFFYVFVRTKGFKNRFVALFRLFLEQWRLMLFVLIFAVYYLIYLAFRINFETVKSEKYNDFGNYVECSNQLYSQCISNAKPAACTATCPIPSYVNYPFWVIVVLGKWGKGMAMFPIFGISKAMIKRIIKNSRTAILTSGGNSSDSRTNKGSLQKITGRIVNTLTEFTREESSEERGEEKQSKGSMMDEIEEGENSSSSSSDEVSSEEEGTAMDNIN